MILVVFAALIMLGLCLGAAVTFAILGALGLAFGIVSSATLLGLLKRRVSTAVRAFHYQVCLWLGAFSGVGVLFVASHFLESGLGTLFLVTSGASAGALCGLAGGWILEKVAHALLVQFEAMTARAAAYGAPSAGGGVAGKRAANGCGQSDGPGAQ